MSSVPQSPVSPSSQPKFPSTPKHVDPRRFYTAFAFLPVLYLGIRYSPIWLFSLLLLATILLALYEFLNLYFGPSRSMVPIIFSCIAAIGVVFSLYQGYSIVLNLWLPGFVVLVMIGFLISPTNMKHHFPSWAIFPFATVYVAWFLGHLLLLRQLEHGEAFVFFILLVTWMGDTGGYAVGLSLGKHLLAPTLSPKKTIEGLIGGVIFAVIGGLLSHVWYFPFFSLNQCAMLGAGMALIGALGDLGESAIKRSVHVKDSGTIIPGHGGVLDRVDSLLFTVPIFYYYTVFTSST